MTENIYANLSEPTCTYTQPNWPKPNGWACYLYGYKTGYATKFMLMGKQKPPCWFHRKMLKLAFGIIWVKEVE